MKRLDTSELDEHFKKTGKYQMLQKKNLRDIL